MIDLHTHTNESDGTYSPAELVEAALADGLEALAISDHDTFAGYDQAAQLAGKNGLDLICGIEVNSRREDGQLDSDRAWSVHILGYFLHEAPAREFRDWLSDLLRTRRERNTKLVDKLQSMGVSITLDEVQALGRTLTGRPHFAQLLVRKGYVSNTDEAFRKYLGESAPGFVQRDSPHTAAAVEEIERAGGLPVLAHPIRLGIRDHEREAKFITELRDNGLRGLEVYHSDHSKADMERYQALAKKLGLAITGGSDFHGDTKPRIRLGKGVNGNLAVPRRVLDDLRNFRVHTG